MKLFKILLGIGSLTLLSRIFGFIRDNIIARIFGTGSETDAFFVAFKIPNLIRRISGEGAFTQAFIPILGEYKSKKNSLELKNLVNKTATLMGLLLIIITLFGILSSHWIIQLVAPGFKDNPDKLKLSVELLQITFPYILFISLTSMAGGILNTFGKFFAPAFTPVLLNLSFIFGAIFFAGFFAQPIVILAWSVFFGGLLQLFFQIPFLKQIGLLPKLDFNFNEPGVWKIIKLMGPAIIGVSIVQISMLINNVFASFLESGSVSWLYYADRLMEFPVGILGVTLSTILLPSLSISFSNKNKEKYSSLLNWGIKLALIISAPAAIALYILSIPLVTTLFFYGAFSAKDVFMTNLAVIGYSFGLVALILIKVLASAFYARQNIRTPVKIAVVTLIATQVFNLIFVNLYQHAGLAIAIGLGACVNALLLIIYLLKNRYFSFDHYWFRFLTKLVIALSIMAMCLNIFKGDDYLWYQYSFLDKLMNLSINIVIGASIYLLSLRVLGIKIEDFLRESKY
jgi:putative peptidoglycan lipid II flippase